jgi:hypothetical protein
MELDDDVLYPSFFRTLFGVYGFPIVMFALAIVPSLRFTYSGHGGPSWFVIPFCGPWVVLRAAYKLWNSAGAIRTWYLWFFKVTIPSYLFLALLLSWIATFCLSRTYGFTISPWFFFADIVSPFPWWFFS